MLVFLIVCRVITIVLAVPPPPPLPPVQPLGPAEIQTVKQYCGVNAPPQFLPPIEQIPVLPEINIQKRSLYDESLVGFTHPRVLKSLLPWTVHLGIVAARLGGEYHGIEKFEHAKRCTGVLISNRHVLTAATCFIAKSNMYHINYINNNRAIITAGLYNWIDSIEGGGGGSYTSAEPTYLYEEIRRTIHPLFNPNRQHDPYDIAIVEMNDNITNDEMAERCVVPICMPTDHQMAYMKETDASTNTLVISGFGTYLPGDTSYEGYKLLYSAKVSPVQCKPGLYQILQLHPPGIMFCVTEFAHKDDMGGPVTFPNYHAAIQQMPFRHHLLGIMANRRGFGPTGVLEYNTVIVPIRVHMDWIYESIGLNYYYHYVQVNIDKR